MEMTIYGRFGSEGGRGRGGILDMCCVLIGVGWRRILTEGKNALTFSPSLYILPPFQIIRHFSNFT